MIAHIVLFSLKEDLPPDRRRAFAISAQAAFAGIPSIRRASVGTSVQIDAGYVRSFGETTYDGAAMLEFEDEKGLVDYLTHPLHDELGRLFWESCSRTVISEVRWRSADSLQDS